MADDRNFTTEALKHGELTAIAALAASGGNIGKAIGLAPSFAAALMPGGPLFGIGASVYDSKKFVFTPESIAAEPAKAGKDPSTRMLISGRSPTAEDDEPEIIRTYRTDTARGREQEKLVRGLLGKRCLVYVFVDEFGVGKNAKKVRVLEHIEQIYGGDPEPKRELVRPDDGPAPERRPAKEAKPMTIEEWLPALYVLTKERREKLAAWYLEKFGADIEDPNEEDLKPGSRLLVVYEKAFNQQEEEMNR